MNCYLDAVCEFDIRAPLNHFLNKFSFHLKNIKCIVSSGEKKSIKNSQKYGK